MVSRDTLTVAGGAVGSSVLTAYVINKWGSQLPGANSVWGRVAYDLLIPFGGAMLVKRVNHRLAQGMIIGGAFMALNDVLGYVLAQTKMGPVAGAKEYLDYTPAPRALNEPVPNYSAVQQFGDSVYDSTPAFRDPWAIVGPGISN